ncbi:hypothetical protein [Clostridium pasteurianum]|uniref:Uncharacterized protein n=1 Tax=Clostridium pasteurianum BC1 TaxID=86416 RepID=R4KCS6_CLOPA|nr:hypothetical protein [Clostridium pasteurianum]AGK97420.1 hypothetical protein Clopa_2560 [Clostridium pasteurianum BC1]AGK98022.1 hypothetical protein Clopa_3211 [Clostridium pasteurianum BC1]
MEDTKLTLFYSKQTGAITAFCTGMQDMSYFASNEEDMKIIWDFIVADYDKYIIKNKDDYYIDLSTKTVKSK